MRSVFLVLFLSLPAAAAPRDFAFTWTSRTAPQGQNGFEVWVTPRLVRTDDFARIDSRIAWVVGVAKNLESQLGVEFDVESTQRTSFVDPRVSSLWRWTTWRSPGSAFAAGGLARVAVGPGILEVEGRLFADVTLGRVLISLNVAGSKLAFWNDRSGVDTRLEETLGLRFAVSSTAFVGLEARARSAWREREYQGTAIYLGPTLTFTHPVFWVNVGAGVQVAADKANADRDLPEPNELRDNERFVLRLAFGIDAK
jgi:hypothetical protein